MYGIITYIYHTNQPNVGTYTIHGSYGLLNHHLGVPNRRELVAMKLAQILPFKKTPTRGNQAPKLDSESTPPTKPSLVRVTSTSKYLPVQVDDDDDDDDDDVVVVVDEEIQPSPLGWERRHYTVSGMNYRSQLVCRISEPSTVDTAH